MDEKEIIRIISLKFDGKNKAKTPLLKRNYYFDTELVKGGINISKLGNNPFLVWDVFVETVKLLERLGGIAKKGDTMLFGLEEKGLDLNTIEKYIAAKIYNKKNGEKVFRRITPIANILIWTGICENMPGKLKLK
jgi:hypothetical protein